MPAERRPKTGNYAQLPSIQSGRDATIASRALSLRATIAAPTDLALGSAAESGILHTLWERPPFETLRALLRARRPRLEGRAALMVRDGARPPHQEHRSSVAARASYYGSRKKI